MKITVENAFMSLDGIKMVINHPLPGNTSYKLYSLVEEINRVLKPANQLLDQYRYIIGSVTEDIAKEKESQYSKIFNEIKNQEEDIKDIYFDVTEFESINIPVAFWMIMNRFMIKNEPRTGYNHN